MAEKAGGNLLPITDQYHETIVIMMLHSTGVNHIAKKLELLEQTVGLHQRRKTRNLRQEGSIPYPLRIFKDLLNYIGKLLRCTNLLNQLQLQPQIGQSSYRKSDINQLLLSKLCLIKPCI